MWPLQKQQQQRGRRRRRKWGWRGDGWRGRKKEGGGMVNILMFTLNFTLIICTSVTVVKERGGSRGKEYISVWAWAFLPITNLFHYYSVPSVQCGLISIRFHRLCGQISHISLTGWITFRSLENAIVPAGILHTFLWCLCAIWLWVLRIGPNVRNHKWNVTQVLPLSYQALSGMCQIGVAVKIVAMPCLCGFPGESGWPQCELFLYFYYRNKKAATVKSFPCHYITGETLNKSQGIHAATPPRYPSISPVS